MRNLRLAIRSLRTTPIVTVVALGTLALGIGANTAIFSFIKGLLLAPLPYPHADRLVSLWERTPSGQRNAMTTLNYLDYAQSSVFEHVAATTVCCGPVILGTGARPIPTGGFHVGGSYFEIFGAHAALGRTLMPGDDQAGRDHVVVISHALWVSQFGADPSLIGRPIRLNGDSYTVVGVMSPDAPFGRGEMVWLPLSFPQDRMIRANHWLVSVTGGAVGRLKPGVTADRARRELETIAARLAVDYPDTNSGWGIVVEPYAAVLVGDDLKRLLVLLLGAVGLVLLIGCVNLANLMIARGLAREREVAIRMALGAGRGRLIRQFLNETLLLSMAGGLIGLGLGYVMMTVLEALLRHQPMNRSFMPYWFPSEATIGIDGSVLVFAFVISVLSGLAFGVVAGVRNTRPATDASFGLSNRVNVKRTHHGVQRVLLVTELGLTFMLLTSAGLLVRSVIAMRAADTGFSGTDVLTADLPIWDRRFPNDDALRAYLRQITAAIEAIPGVRDVAVTDGLPLQGVPTGMFIQVVGQPVVDRGRRPTCDFKVASPAYFRALALRVRAGRALLDSDRFGAPYVTVINETMARLYFPHSNPVGQHLLMQVTRPDTTEEIAWTIVGVIVDERLTPFDDRRERPAAYVPVDQVPTTFAALVVRTATDPNQFREAIRRAVMGVDRGQAIREMRTVEQLESDGRAPDRLRAWLLGMFAGVALVLSAIGVYGMFAYAVGQRTHELGIRAALGARRGHLVWLILRQGAMLTVVGLGVGFLAVLAVTRLLRTFLFGVHVVDPIAISTMAATLAAVAVLACYIPARRATMVDPLTALRAE